MGNFSLQCLGVGDGWPCADRNHSAFLYRFGNTRILVDAGDGVCRSLKTSGVLPDQIDSVFLSHLHSDHIGGFFMLMQGFWLGPRKKDLTVHMPADGVRPIRQMLDAGMIFDELLSYDLRFQPLKAGCAEKVGRVKVTPFHTTHLETLRAAHQKRHPLRFEAFSFLLECGKLRVGHSADLGSPEDLNPLVEKPLDLLVCELAHFTLKAIFSYLRDKPVKRVVFIHLEDRHWRNLKPLSAQARKSLGGIPFSFAKDGDEFHV